MIELLSFWLPLLVQASRVSDWSSTVRAAESQLKQHILPRVGSSRLQELNAKHLQAFVTTLAATGITRKTIANVLQTLSRRGSTGGGSPAAPTAMATATRADADLRPTEQFPNTMGQCKGLLDASAGADDNPPASLPMLFFRAPSSLSSSQSTEAR